MRRAHLIAATVAALFSATPVVAADMPVKARGPAIVPVYNWTGFYAGVNLGGSWTSGSGTITLGGASGPYSGSGNGVLGGVQAGYNYQAGAMVLGVETDFQASGARGTVTGTPGAATITGTGKVPWFGTIRGRLGYAVDRWMLYATGGAVYGWSKLDGTVSTTGPFSSSASYWTWTVGGGIETALWTRWTGKVEYLYAGSPSNVPTPPGTTAVTGSGRTHVLRAGLNYRF